MNINEYKGLLNNNTGMSDECQAVANYILTTGESIDKAILSLSIDGDVNEIRPYEEQLVALYYKNIMNADEVYDQFAS